MYTIKILLALFKEGKNLNLQSKISFECWYVSEHTFHLPSPKWYPAAFVYLFVCIEEIINLKKNSP